jgi:hypothetical protein
MSKYIQVLRHVLSRDLSVWLRALRVVVIIIIIIIIVLLFSFSLSLIYAVLMEEILVSICIKQRVCV